MKFVAGSRVSLASVALLLGCAAVPKARPPGSAEFRQACLDATTDVTVLNLAAHPDDEAARSLVYLRRKHGFRTVTLYSTCGEGGQNAIGSEIGMKLARLRTRETLRAAAITGARVSWLGFADFGFSKRADETFAVWGRRRFRDALAASLREIQPDLLMTNHSPNRGHGHHRASALALRELAGDVPLFERLRRRSKESADLTLQTGDIDPVTDKPYASQAMRGWLQHRTQGGWAGFSLQRLRPDRWRRVGKNLAFHLDQLPTLFDEPGLQQALAVGELTVTELRQQLAAFARHETVSAHVARALRLLPQLRVVADAAGPELGAGARRRLGLRINALERVVLLGSRITVSASLQRDRYSPGDTARLRVRVQAPSQVLYRVAVEGKSATLRRELGRDTAEVLVDLKLPAITDPAQVWPGEVRPSVVIGLHGTAERIVDLNVRPVVRWSVVPEAQVIWGRRKVYIDPRQSTFRATLPIDLEWNRGDPESMLRDVRLHIDCPPGITATTEPVAPRLSAQQRRARIKVVLSRTRSTGEDPVQQANWSGMITARLVRLGHLEASCSAEICAVRLRRPQRLRVGLVQGVDQTLRQVLADLGVEHEVLSVAKLRQADLARFTTVVLDIRAYRTRRDLRHARERLWEFCRRGGRVLCLYHKPGEWNVTPQRPLLAPFPLVVGNDRVCEESVKVSVLQAGHPLLTLPHRIGATDFAGWVQERALNVPATWDDRYQSLLSMADAGEAQLRGTLLVTAVGRGSFVYCALALYRQWRVAHPGAARLLINLLHADSTRPAASRMTPR